MILLSSFWWLTATIVARRFFHFDYFFHDWTLEPAISVNNTCILLPFRKIHHVALLVCVFPGSAIRRLTGGECGPCIGAAHSVALVTLRAETCVSVSILYLCCLGRWWLWGLIRFRGKMKMLQLIATTVGGLLLTPTPLQSKTL